MIKKILCLIFILLFLSFLSTCPNLKSSHLDKQLILNEIEINNSQDTTLNHINNNIWTTTEVVSTESTWHSERASIAVDNYRTVHVVWDDETNYNGCGGEYDIFYKYKPLNGNWTITEVVSTESNKWSQYPSIAVGADGTVHVVWFDLTNYDECGWDVDVFYKKKPFGGNWTMTEVVSTESIYDSWMTSIDVEPDGTVHVSWSESNDYSNLGGSMDIYYKKNPPGTTWLDNPTELVSSESTEASSRPTMAVDSQGTVHIAWQDGYTIYHPNICYKNKPKDGSWTTTQIVSMESNKDSLYPSLAIDSNYNVHVAWEDESNYAGCGNDQDIFYKKRTNDGSWTSTEVVSTESNEDSILPSLDVEPDGTVHIAWKDESEYNEADVVAEIFYKHKPNFGSWNPTEVVSTDTDSPSWDPSLGVSNNGTVHVVWQDWANYQGSGGRDMDVFHKMRCKSPNKPPNQPSLIGDIEGITNTQYYYRTNTTDPDNDGIMYGLDWDGDNTVDEWDDNNGNYYTSGEQVEICHSWPNTGTYYVKVKAKDPHGAESDWSGSLTVNITSGGPPSTRPNLNIKSIRGPIGIIATIENVGTDTARSIQWSLDIDGDIVIWPLGGTKSGNLGSITPDEQKTVRIFVLGFGSATITIEVGCSGSSDRLTKSGFMLGPFVIMI